MATELNLTPRSAWSMIYCSEPSINWYATKIENVKAMRLRLKVVKYGCGGFEELIDFIKFVPSPKSQIMFLQLLLNEKNNKRQYKLINIQFIGSKVRIMIKAKLEGQIDLIMNEFPVTHLSIKLNENKLDSISQQYISCQLNKYRGPYKVEYNFCCKTYNDHINTNNNDKYHNLQLNQLKIENEKLQSKIKDLESKLFEKQQELNLLMDYDEKENNDYCLKSFHLFMDEQIKIDEIKTRFIKIGKYNDIRMMEYLDEDILSNDIGINNKLFIKLILNECKEFIISKQRFVQLIANKRYIEILNNKGIYNVQQFEAFIKTENKLKDIGIKNQSHRKHIWYKVMNEINGNDSDSMLEGNDNNNNDTLYH